MPRRLAEGVYEHLVTHARLVDAWVLYDNSGDVPVLVEAEGRP